MPQNFVHIWCVVGNHGLGWKSKLFRRAKNAKKVKKLIFWHSKFNKIFLKHGSGWKVNFSVEWKIWKKRKNSFFETPSLTSYFSNPIKLEISRLAYSTLYKTRQFCTEIKIDQFHPKPWFPKTHDIYKKSEFKPLLIII